MEILVSALGYDGSYNRVAAFARAWKEECHRLQQTAGRGSFVPLSFAPGEAFQFDWSEDFAVIRGRSCQAAGGARQTLLSSRAFTVRAYLLQTHEMLFDAHNHAFRVLGGVPRRGIYDNMRTAVDKVGRGKERSVNARFSAMTSHYLFEAEFCNPASGWEKGCRSRRTSRMRVTASGKPCPRSESLGALNGWLEERCRELWGQTRHGGEPGNDRRCLGPRSREPHACGPAIRWVRGSYQAGPHRPCLRSTWNVTATACRRRLPTDRSGLRVYPDKLVVAAEGDMSSAQHPRVIDRTHNGPGRTVYDWRHYLAVIQRKPGALRNGAPFLLELPERIQATAAPPLAPYRWRPGDGGDPGAGAAP